MAKLIAAIDLFDLIVVFTVAVSHSCGSAAPFLSSETL